ncbi:glucose-1-phosphate thymidylyltransferase [Paramagnetospirillum kuznetsovii]|uniref:Glucose-1-phosphate thymidylyltransferase n=1 Tax=Paramagnetospirillum kuznetsovii TaxID=2053833 RepID=A0A364P2L6_9PROT|nr:glucose-1-phosphate thymidylyltransferase RfbA [Paramagnetospirillum kuznetsovii]RAU23598.1 glucose-1-phosphate thymidylyltransferase [Paramagnetospirillum kuznetsovii]
MKGIILAGGTGSRLYPLTAATNKQLISVYDKPLIYYPLATLMLAGIREVLIITRPEDSEIFAKVIGDGARLGMDIQYATQPSPDGIPQAFIIGRDFIKGEPCALVLGDNVFFGHGLRSILRDAAAHPSGATIFGYWVSDPERFGVVTFDKDFNAVDLAEKPKNPKSNYAVTGLYFYDGKVCDLAASLKPSPRGETEITDLNRLYLDAGELHVRRLERGFAWLDTGTPDALLDAANYIATIERRQGLKIACIEEIAWRQGWIDDERLQAIIATMKDCAYGQYLKLTLERGR